MEGEAEKVGLHMKEKKIDFYQRKYRDVLELELDNFNLRERQESEKNDHTVIM